jgi:Gpi18-like mannosyltransferase
VVGVFLFEGTAALSPAYHVFANVKAKLVFLKRLCHDLLLIFVDNVAHPFSANYLYRVTIFLQQGD